MLDALAFPRVGDVNQTIAGLDYRRIGKTVRRFRIIFQNQRGAPIRSGTGILPVCF